MLYFYAILSALAVSLASFVGVALLTLRRRTLLRLLPLLLCFAAGALLGNSFFDLLPDAYRDIPDSVFVSVLVMSGFLFFLLTDILLHRQFHQKKSSKKLPARTPIASFGYLSLVSDGIHNFTDGVLIALAWLSSAEAGVALTLAVALHEIPQEIGDFGILLKAGFSRRQALWLNFYVALTAVVGAVLVLTAGERIQHFSTFMLPFAAGGFLYLAAVNLLPEIFRTGTWRQAPLYLLFVLLGLMLMYCL